MRLLVAGLIRVRLGSLRRASWSSGSFRLACVHLVAPRVHSSSGGFTLARLGSPGLFGFAWVHLGAQGALKVLSGLLGFTQRA